jgi:hypothetical protein
MQATMLAAVSNICRGPVATTPMRSSFVIPQGSVGGKNGTAAGSRPRKYWRIRNDPTA